MITLISAGPYEPPIRRQRSQAPLVERLREEVSNWRNAHYPEVSETTKTLLGFWFNRDHVIGDKPNAPPFKYYFCQREAIETLIYCYEKARARRMKHLERFLDQRRFGLAYDPRYDRFPKYCFKMATGTGKTKVMSLAVVWSYFHKLYEKDSPLTQNFLILAPNVTVFERLKEDFGGGKIFRTDPLIPEEWKTDWQLKTTMRGESPSLSTSGNLFLTNIQQLYEKASPEPINPVGALLPPRPKKQIEISSAKLVDVLSELPDLMIINDEAHHVHEERLEWAKLIQALHNELESKNKKGLTAQLDFSATPQDQTGHLFEHIIVDYPLADAIDATIVKRIKVGVVKNPKERKECKNPADRFNDWIWAGINRWEEYKKVWKPLGRTPVLFILAENTKASEQIYEYLETIPQLKGHILRIDTDRFGDVSKEQENQIRQWVREIDKPTNKWWAIVSVLMLREGWDVKSVTVVVGLRAFTAEAKILPEQAVGRGLRLIWGPGSERVKQGMETVDIIGNKHFLEIVDGLKTEGVKLATVDLDKERVEQIAVKPLEERHQYDIEIPYLTPRYSIGELQLDNLELKMLPQVQIDIDEKEDIGKIKYAGYDARKLALVKGLKPEFTREWPRLQVRNSIEAVNYFTRQVMIRGKLPDNAYRILAPLIMDYIQNVLFGKPVSLEDQKVLDRLNCLDAQKAIFDAFAEGIKKITKRPSMPRKKPEAIHLKDTPPFLWNSNQTTDLPKTVFNLVAWDVGLERDFAKFLSKAHDVKKFAKLVHWRTLFKLEYLSAGAGLRHYWPDFVVELKSGDRWIVETKGIEDEDVPLKDERARQWCQDATFLTGTKWSYIKVPYALFEEKHPKTFSEIIALMSTTETTRQTFLNK
jgi:type III restriction enzyme